MSFDLRDEDFLLTITDVFSITGRGTVVVGAIESGTLRTGDTVEVWDGVRLVATAEVAVEFIYGRHLDPRSVGLVLGDVDRDIFASGQVVRRRAAGPKDASAPLKLAESPDQSDQSSRAFR